MWTDYNNFVNPKILNKEFLATRKVLSGTGMNPWFSWTSGIVCTSLTPLNSLGQTYKNEKENEKQEKGRKKGR